MMNKKVNYIVSGLERSGTSLMMQILEAGGIPIAYDNLRKADKNNLKGYYELEGGKIIIELKNKSFPMEKYKGRFIKITSYGLQFLPKGKYEILYMIRNIDEIVDSSVKMSKNKDKINKEEMRKVLVLYENRLLEKEKDNPNFIPIFYKALVTESTKDDELSIIKCRYPEFDMEKAKQVIDKKLYHNRSN